MESTTQSPQTHKRRSRNVSTPSLTSQKALISPKWYMGNSFVFCVFFSYLFFFVLESSTGAVETHIIPLENVCEGDFLQSTGHKCLVSAALIDGRGITHTARQMVVVAPMRLCLGNIFKRLKM